MMVLIAFIQIKLLDFFSGLLAVYIYTSQGILQLFYIVSDLSNSNVILPQS